MDAFDRLIENQFLRNEDEISEFLAAIHDATNARMPLPIGKVFEVFTDLTAEHEVMWSLIHLIETIYDQPNVLSQVCREAIGLKKRAPEWAEIIICRILNSQPHREAYTVIAQSLSSTEKVELSMLLQSIKESEPDLFGVVVDDLLKKLN